MAENPVLVPVHPPTPGLSHPSLAEHLRVNYDLWRNNGVSSDGDQSGSDGQAGVSEGVRWVIWGAPLIIQFGSIDPNDPPPPYIREDGLAPM